MAHRQELPRRFPRELVPGRGCRYRVSLGDSSADGTYGAQKYWALVVRLKIRGGEHAWTELQDRPAGILGGKPVRKIEAKSPIGLLGVDVAWRAAVVGCDRGHRLVKLRVVTAVADSQGPLFPVPQHAL